MLIDGNSVSALTVWLDMPRDGWLAALSVSLFWLFVWTCWEMAALAVSPLDNSSVGTMTVWLVMLKDGWWAAVLLLWLLVWRCWKVVALAVSLLDSNSAGSAAITAHAERWLVGSCVTALAASCCCWEVVTLAMELSDNGCVGTVTLRLSMPWESWQLCYCFDCLTEHAERWWH